MVNSVNDLEIAIVMLLVLNSNKVVSRVFVSLPCVCVCVPLQSMDRVNSITNVRPREPRKLGNIWSTEHLQEEDRAVASTHTAGTEASQCVCEVNHFSVCVCVCVFASSPHPQRRILLPAAGPRSAAS